MATGLDPEHQRREREHREVLRGALLVARGDPAALLQPVDQPLDAIPLALHRTVERAVAPVAGPLVPPVWDDGGDVSPREQETHRRVAVALVTDELRRAAAGAPAPSTSNATAGEQGVEVE
jgi:hypothetical protein